MAATITTLPAQPALPPSSVTTRRLLEYDDDGIRVSAAADLDLPVAAPAIDGGSGASPAGSNLAAEAEAPSVAPMAMAMAMAMPPPPSYDDIAVMEFCRDERDDDVGHDDAPSMEPEPEPHLPEPTTASALDSAATAMELSEGLASSQDGDVETPPVPSAGGYDPDAVVTDVGTTPPDDGGATDAMMILDREEPEEAWCREEAPSAADTSATSSEGSSLGATNFPSDDTAGDAAPLSLAVAESSSSDDDVDTELHRRVGGESANLLTRTSAVDSTDVVASAAVSPSEDHCSAGGVADFDDGIRVVGTDVSEHGTEETRRNETPLMDRADGISSTAITHSDEVGVVVASPNDESVAVAEGEGEGDAADSPAVSGGSAAESSETEEPSSPAGADRDLVASSSDLAASVEHRAAATVTVAPRPASSRVVLRESRHGASVDTAALGSELNEDDSWMNQPIGHGGQFAAVPFPPPPAPAAATSAAEEEDQEEDQDQDIPSVIVPPPPAVAFEGNGSGETASRENDDESGGGPSSVPPGALPVAVPVPTSHARSVSDGDGGGTARAGSIPAAATPSPALAHGRSASAGGWLEGISEETGWGRSPSSSSSPLPPHSTTSPSSPRTRSTSDGSDSVSVGGSSHHHHQGHRRIRSSLASISASVEGSMMQKIFGEATPGAALAARRRRSSSSSSPAVDVTSMAGSLLPRAHLPYEITHNPTSGLWIAAVHTNQKALDRGDVLAANRSKEAFSFDAEDLARAAAQASAPPRMHPFSDCPSCFVCEKKFALLRRPCHCRNCGVCVCSKCATSWPARMVPSAYNIKGESAVNVCAPCDWLANAFREALLGGDHDRAFALHATGNVNLRSPFCNLKGEEFYPVHCAAMGGNTTTLRWLLEYQHCPITASHAGRKKKSLAAAESRSLLTSKGRSVLDIAVSRQHVDVLRYLVVERGVSILGIQDLRTALLTLDTVLRRLPPADDDRGAGSGPASPTGSGGGGTEQHPRPESWSGSAAFSNSGAAAAMAALDSVPPSDAAMFQMAEDVPQMSHSEESDVRKASDDDKREISEEDECIICFDREINCVATPCGHQLCCLECSSGLSECPVCKCESVFIRIFKP